MLISIVVPVYNAEEYIGKCIASIEAQTYADWELILVDDGSTDDSPRLCDRYAATDNRVRVVHTPNRGASAARNTGIESAQGQWITFIDADDYVTPTYLEDMISAAKSTGSDIAVTGWVKGDETKVFAEAVVERSDFLYFYRTHENYGYVLGKLYSRRLFDRGLRFETGVKWAEDAIFFNRALLLSKKVAVVPKANYIYNYHEGSSVHRLHSFDDEIAGVGASYEVIGKMVDAYGRDILNYYNPYAHVWRAVKSVYGHNTPHSERLKMLRSIDIDPSLLRNTPKTMMERFTTRLTMHRCWRVLDIIMVRSLGR